MYNTNFKVKYNDIKAELLLNVNDGTESGYTQEDVFDVCSKLYRDEITSVFYAENIIDDKIDEGIKTILDKMILNDDFNQIIETMRTRFKDYMLLPGVETNSETNDTNSITFILFMTLFSENIFWLTHQCICQQLLHGFIEKDLLEKLSILGLNEFKS